ncbi:hypothetical protein ZEAMMB73_Zm00001d008942 [Zea mays]|uniref:Uncharacterized protein n=1 Tax=Zea mays TaxID=4577 RepID=A0A1D6FGT6_MAIZE|nr:hypothetical protein ZEAMMB73_Zm00001d008942 [Zea mays]
MPIPPPRCGSCLRIRRKIPSCMGTFPTALREIHPPLAATLARSLSSTSLPRSQRRRGCVGRRRTQRTPCGGCGRSSTPSGPPRRWQPDSAIEPPNRADPRVQFFKGCNSMNNLLQEGLASSSA